MGKCNDVVIFSWDCRTSKTNLHNGHTSIFPQKTMNKTTLIFLMASLSACASNNPYKTDDPVDQALKICGLGYSSQSAVLYKGAYAFALKQGGAEFETQMNEYLKSQTTAMYESLKPTGKDELDIVQKEIESNRACVLSLIEKNRPKTRSDFVSSCMTDLKGRVGDTGNNYPKVLNWSVVELHPLNTANNIVVNAFVNTGGSSSYWTTVACRVRNNVYDDLVGIDSK